MLLCATNDARERLFAAAERVLLVDDQCGTAHLLAVGGELTHETLYGASSQSSIGVITFAFGRTQAASASAD